MKYNSEIVNVITGMLYPFIIIFGFYIIINGHITPGGGFQGGAMLSAVFISRYLVFPVADMKIDIFKLVEKVLFLFILFIPVLFLFCGLKDNLSNLNTLYLMIMNVLIGIKVCCGLTIIFYRFVFHESR